MTVFLFFLAVLGVCVGSFLAALVARTVTGMPMDWSSRSQCMHCSHRLAIRDLVPLLSYVIRGRKCAYCHVPISSQYFFIEAATLLLFVAVGYAGGIPVTYLEILNLLILLLTFSTLLYCSIVDYFLQAFPVWGLLFVSIIQFVLSVFVGAITWQERLLSALGYVLLLWGIKILGTMVWKKDAMGEGDLYMAWCMGMFLGFGGSIVSFYGAIFSGAFMSIYILLTKRPIRSLPFAPFLFFGTTLAYFFGERILLWYSTHFFL